MARAPSMLPRVKLGDLSPEERRAFVGLVRLMVRIDGEFSAQEVQALTLLARDVGSLEFWTEMRNAQEVLASADDVVRAVEEVNRQPVCEWMYGALMGLAAVDGIDVAESDLLGWLGTTWNL